ncbi:hypothetical protein GCM10022247_27130 [Allokutzneria multivorans]|uniref:Uncharacterized protein n=1 Tax=Allokutzneria multivorans TaxID=1142134 RepID=A0ABP7S0C8_9PSEU
MRFVVVEDLRERGSWVLKTAEPIDALSNGPFGALKELNDPFSALGALNGSFGALKYPKGPFGALR